MGSRRHRGARSITRRALIAFALVGCSPSATAPASDWPKPPSDAVVGEVVAGIDGDSLRIDVQGRQVELRLEGVNAPEFDECHAAPAADLLRRLVDEEVSVDVVTTDQYGRAVGYVWTETMFVNGSLVEDGHAIAMSTDGEWTEALIGAEEAARRRALGLWAPDACGEQIGVDVVLEMTQPDPPGPDNDVLDSETVTIRNNGETPADISGFVLRDESTVNRLRMPPGTVIPPGGTLVIGSGCSAPIGWCSPIGVWNNGGDSALLVGPRGTIVAHVRHHPAD